MTQMRRQFELPHDDQQFLEALGLPWETAVEGNTRWMILHNYPTKMGYTLANVSLGLELSASYPDTQIDMVYFFPHLAQTDGKSIAQLTNRSFDGKVWQRWSRHRTEANPWRRGYDCIETHLLLVDEWLERAVRIAA